MLCTPGWLLICQDQSTGYAAYYLSHIPEMIIAHKGLLMTNQSQQDPEDTTPNIDSESVHNLDQYMFDLKHILTHGKKKIGILIGGGAPVSINVGTEGGSWESLIPDIAGLTEIIKSQLDDSDLAVYKLLEEDLPNSNLELILSRVRSLEEILGAAKVHGYDSTGYSILNENICSEIKDVVSKSLPKGENPYSKIVSWITGINRKHPVEIFTTNYDLLMEEAFERAKSPYFDGFSGSRLSFFDPASISSNDLPPRWSRLWKLHGSINWAKREGEVVRVNDTTSGEMVYPSHIKYDQTQSAPFSSMFERLKEFLLEPDSLLITAGFSFADAHISSKLDECLSANPSTAVFAFQYKGLEDEKHVTDIASRRSNLSAYCNDGAVINGVKGKWKLGDLPSKNWQSIRFDYWNDKHFLLGDFQSFTNFLGSSGGDTALTAVENTTKEQNDV